ncbi:hypothetical protein SLEP1_g18428 [Rubroshorea leprosula]|uniref:AB hydrolase-1 domain-containing protein n=1 Tax=Rubroshorea leprosula TaxID=152421 RepID=A0AAV5J989_9ROSI|nr:hypothetical protein SLEP1_g18428 [Rubroshorea leprosula]
MVTQEKSLSEAMNARIIGSGTDLIVLAHGYGTDQSIWDKILPPLSQHFQVLLFDWSFSGAVEDTSLFDPVKHSSYDGFANDLISLLDELNVKSSIFFGHSMSGLIGCIASVKRPDLFKSLVLIAASPRYMNADDYEGGFGESDIDDLISILKSNYDAWASHFPSEAIDAKDPLSVEKLRGCLKRMRPEVAIPVAEMVFRSDYRNVLEKVLTPCTIIQPSNDKVVPNSVAYYMQKNIKGKSTVEIVEMDGHFPQLTAHLHLLDVLGGVLGFEI